MARLALTAEPRRRSCVPDVFLVGHGLLTGRAPAEAFRDPRGVPHVAPLGTTALAVPPAIPRSIACHAGEGKAIAQRLVPAEVGDRLVQPAVGTALGGEQQTKRLHRV